jgi:hypothetical protein
MKILRIESPSKLKDGTVKASIIVSKEDYIPLIVMGDRGDKGEELDLDIKGHDPTWEYESFLPILELLKDQIEKAFERGKISERRQQCG